MKSFTLAILCIFFLSILSGCQTVVVTPADELTSKNWQAETLSGIKGNLNFQGDTASLTIVSSQDEVTLSGHLSIDSRNFYITSEEYYRTYTFSYTVYHNRVLIEYGGDTLVFYPAGDKITQEPQTQKTP